MKATKAQLEYRAAKFLPVNGCPTCRLLREAERTGQTKASWYYRLLSHGCASVIAQQVRP